MCPSYRGPLLSGTPPLGDRVFPEGRTERKSRNNPVGLRHRSADRNFHITSVK